MKRKMADLDVLMDETLTLCKTPPVPRRHPYREFYQYRKPSLPQTPSDTTTPDLSGPPMFEFGSQTDLVPKPLFSRSNSLPSRAQRPSRPPEPFQFTADIVKSPSPLFSRRNTLPSRVRRAAAADRKPSPLSRREDAQPPEPTHLSAVEAPLTSPEDHPSHDAHLDDLQPQMDTLTLSDTRPTPSKTDAPKVAVTPKISPFLPPPTRPAPPIPAANPTPPKPTPSTATPSKATPSKPTPSKPNPSKPTPSKSTPSKAAPSKAITPKTTPLMAAPSKAIPLKMTPMRASSVMATTPKRPSPLSGKGSVRRPGPPTHAAPFQPASPMVLSPVTSHASSVTSSPTPSLFSDSASFSASAPSTPSTPATSPPSSPANRARSPMCYFTPAYWTIATSPSPVYIPRQKLRRKDSPKYDTLRTLRAKESDACLERIYDQRTSAYMDWTGFTALTN
ncbi:hypothetical protein ACJQWK_06627 [Exserohilum turcicum]